MTAKLQITGLSKTFGTGARQVEALHEIDLSLADNEFVSLVGTSGCGKSTLLSIVAGLQEFDRGELLVDGAPVMGPGLDRGVVFQTYTLLPWLTARQNVEFALKAAGLKRTQCREVAMEHLELVKLAKFADAYPSQLSGGMQQRVAIARAFLPSQDAADGRALRRAGRADPPPDAGTAHPDLGGASPDRAFRYP
jgi:NitT/TauT family transport system ATP-binding protein